MTKIGEIQDTKRLLFVDDEEPVLQGLKRALHPMRNEWSMHFSNSGKDALEIVRNHPVDMVVTDLRMPGMDGVELLTEIQAYNPGIIRYVLSGYADRFMVLRCAGPAHRFLAKPCETEMLIKAIRRAFSIRQLIHSHPVQRLLDEGTELPRLPVLYGELMRTLQSSESSLADISTILSRDAESADRLLRLVNSAFLGYIDNINQAVTYMGAEAISAIVLIAGVFEQFLEEEQQEFDIRGIYDHCISVGATAGRWVGQLLKDRKRSEEATMAGMTHDIGKLILVRNYPEQWSKAMSWAEENKVLPHAGEREVFDVTHAEVGAALLSRWGVADNIVEAVAYHHLPSKSLTRDKNALFAVHVTNALSHKWHDRDVLWKRRFDEEYFRQVNPEGSLQEYEAASGVAE